MQERKIPKAPKQSQRSLLSDAFSCLLSRLDRNKNHPRKEKRGGILLKKLNIKIIQKLYPKRHVAEAGCQAAAKSDKIGEMSQNQVGWGASKGRTQDGGMFKQIAKAIQDGGSQQLINTQ